MSELNEKHPDIYQKSEEGKLTDHQITGPFNRVWTGLALEETFNKEGNTSQSTEARNKYIKENGLEAIVITERNEAYKIVMSCVPSIVNIL